MLCRDTVCPENIKEHWIKAVEQLLEKRAKRVTRILHAVAQYHCHACMQSQNLRIATGL